MLFDALSELFIKKKYATVSYLFASLHSQLNFKNQLIKPKYI